MRVEIPNTITATIGGLISRGVKAVEVTDGGRLVFTLTDGSTVDVGSVVGPQGEKGSTGAQGPKGETGVQGPKGETGAGFLVKGYYETASALEASVQEPMAGDAYGVGVSEPYDIYIFDGVTESWINNGPLQGARGEKGDKGDPGADGAPGKDGAQGPAGADGTPGQDGTTFTPSVSAAGVLSWTNDGGKQNPASVSIRGPAGAAGKDPEPFYVNCTIVGPNMYDENVTHDKTYAQILTAHQAGRPCYVVVDSSDSDKIYLPLTRLVEGNDAMAIFSLAQMVTGDAPEELQVFYVLISPYYAEGFRGSRYTVAINTQSLPAVSTSDNGKFLQVVKGAWTAVTIPDAEGGSY